MTHPAISSESRLIPSDEVTTAHLHPDHATLKVKCCGLTDPGRVRSSNQDQFLVAFLTKALQVQYSSLAQPKIQYGQEHGHFLVVADGMGGHAGGQQASALAVDTIENFMLNTLKWFFHLKGKEADDALAEFQTALAQADARIMAEAARHPELSGMGTTLTMAYCLNRDLFVVHAGDSRCYLLREGTLYRLTRDHTFVQDLVLRGALRPDEAAHHQLRHVITNAVGGETAGVRVEVHKVHLQARDVLMLCSDGLTEMVADQEIADILQAEADPERACRRLIDRANELGGKDNVTVIVAHFDEANHPAT